MADKKSIKFSQKTFEALSKIIIETKTHERNLKKKLKHGQNDKVDRKGI